MANAMVETASLKNVESNFNSYGPGFMTKLDLMGIRFMADDAGGEGAGEDKEEGKEKEAEESTETEEQKEKDAPKDKEEDKDKEKTYTDKDFREAVNAEVEKKIQARISRETEKTSRITKELEGVRKSLTDTEQEAAELKGKYEDLQTEQIRFKLAAENGVSVEIVSALSGKTEDELARSLAVVLGKKKDQKKNDSLDFSGKNFSNANADLSEIDEAVAKLLKEN